MKVSEHVVEQLEIAYSNLQIAKLLSLEVGDDIEHPLLKSDSAPVSERIQHLQTVLQDTLLLSRER